MKIWYILSFLFCVYSIWILNDERHQVTYELEENKKEPILRLSCLKLTEVTKNRVKINLKELNGMLYDHFKRLIFNSRTMTFYTKESFERDKKFILKKIEQKMYMIYRKLICFISENQKSSNFIYYFIRGHPYYSLFHN